MSVSMYNAKIKNGIHSPILFPKINTSLNMVSHNHEQSFNILRDLNTTYVLPPSEQLTNHYSFTTTKKISYKPSIGMQFNSISMAKMIDTNNMISSRGFHIDLPPNLTEYVIDKSAHIELYDIYDVLESPNKNDFVENPFSKQKNME